jgi:polysaccharide export outer membrane protein
MCALAIMCSVFSCIPRKNYIYLQNRTVPSPDTVVLKVVKEKYVVRPGDVLYVTVLSPDQEATQVFNLEVANNRASGMSGGGGGGGGGDGGGYMNGYTISEEGTIRIPMLGKVKVQGLSIAEIDDMLTDKLSYYLKDVIVKVRFMNFKVTVLGEVKNPGAQMIMADRYTILEAIGAANDLTDFGNRREVELMRATPDGYIVYKIDLTDQNLVQSKSFFMAPNDVLYVKPVTAKMVRLNYPVYTYITTGVSAILLSWSIYNRFITP